MGYAVGYNVGYDFRESGQIPPVMPFYVWELSIKAGSCYNEIAAYYWPGRGESRRG
jgi:hypothetical protein